MNDNPSQSFDVREFLEKGKKKIATASVLGLVAGIIFAIVSPKWYMAELVVVPASGSKGGLGSLSGAAAQLGVSDIPFDLGGGSDVDRIAAVFHSNSVTDRIIAQYGLMKRYRLRYLEDAREAVWKLCATKNDKKASLLTLTCEDKVPATAQAMVLTFAEASNQVMRRVSVSSAGEERRFLETRVSEARADLDKAAVKLRDFQEQNKVISLPEQAKAIVTSIATLRAEMLDKQMQLAYVDGFSSSDESTSGGLRRQVSILQSKLKSLQEARTPANPAATGSNQSGKRAADESRSGSGIFPPAMEVPILQYQLEQLMRDSKMQETLYGLLMQRYELARVNEARDTSNFVVLDAPIIPTKKSRPRRVLVAVEGLGAGVFLGVALAALTRKKRRGPTVGPAASPEPSA